MTTATRRAPTPLRPTAVAEQTRPLARRVPTVHTLARRKADSEDGFVAKVLQPDGTLKEEFFPSKLR